MSPYRIIWEPGVEDAIHLLETLYAPDEFLFVGGTYDIEVKTVADLLSGIKEGDTFPFIIPNPFDGKEHQTKSGTMSRRCDAAIAAYRFALVEFDILTHTDQVAFWHSIISDDLLPVAALIDSGNKSIHAWLRADLPHEGAWRREVRDRLYHPETGRMTLLGADRACQNPSRLARFPGHIRQKTKRMQKLLYLNP
jgi:hypothetical protein